MKKLLLASAIIASGYLGLAAAPAEAKVNVGIYFGTPHYDYRVGPNYRFRPGFGWYRPGIGMGRLTCNEAKRVVRRSGFRNVVTRECNGGTYTFRATNRNGRTVIVYVNSRSGGVWRG